MDKNTQSGIIHKVGTFLWDLFASLKFSIFLFSSLTMASIVGTLIPDRIGLLKFLEGKHVFLQKIVHSLELFDIYSSWWFVLLIILLGVNIICCSFERLPGVFKIILKKPSPPSPPRVESLKFTNRVSINKDFNSSIEFTREAFKSRGIAFYERECANSFTSVCEKGRWTRLGVYITHLGFLLLIIGGLIGNLLGFSGTLDIPEKEGRSVVKLFKNKGEVDLGFNVFLDYFEIIRYDNGTPKSYESQIIINKDKEDELKGVVKVNSPIRYNSLKFIQSGYGRVLKDGVKISVYKSDGDIKLRDYDMKEGQTITLPDEKTKFTLFSFRPNFHISKLNLGETFIGFIFSDDKDSAVALPVNNPGFDKHRRGKFFLRVEDFKTKNYTSLQVSKDPGVLVVYLGFVLLILGCYISFFLSHKSYYILIKNCDENSCEILFAVNANKRKDDLEKDLVKFSNDFGFGKVEKGSFDE